MARVDTLPSLSARLSSLVALDQAHPGTFGVKYRLGELHLAVGQPEAAVAYLKAADALKGSRGITEDEAQVANLEYARTLLLVGRPTEAIAAVARSARSGNPASLLVRARAYVQAGDINGALGDFGKVWDAKDAQKSAPDYVLYARALAAGNRAGEGLSVLQTCEETFGYQPGSGLLESTLLEQLGRWLPSVLAAFKEALYQETQGGIAAAQIDTNLGALAGRRDLSSLSSPQGARLLAGLSAFAHSRWAEAASELAAGLAQVDDPFGTFVRLACSLETEKVTPTMLAAYVALEGRYGSYPPFYYHLWRGMKRGRGDYSLKNVRGVLEKTILLAPSSSVAEESRAELGRLLDLDAAESQWLLLRPELDAIDARLLAGADPASALPRVVRLLSIRRENVYTSDGMLMLRSALSLPPVARYVAGELEKATGPLKDRLQQIQ